MVVLMSSVCYAWLNSYAYGPPQYKEGILLSGEEDNAQQLSIAAAVPCVLYPNEKGSFSSPNAIGVFRCVPKRGYPGLSINDYMRFPTTSRFLFCLVEFNDTDTSVRVFRVTYKNCIYSLEPTEFELLPNFPPSEESRSKDELPKGPLTQSLKHRLEEIKSCNARMLCRMERVYDAAGDWH